jgi:hypothetical protein
MGDAESMYRDEDGCECGVAPEDRPTGCRERCYELLEQKPEVILKFPWPEWEVHAKNAMGANGLWKTVFDFDNYLRETLKYHELSEEVHEKVQEIRDRLWEEVRDNEVSDLFS